MITTSVTMGGFGEISDKIQILQSAGTGFWGGEL
jgi:hypothetical protein